MRKVNNGMRIPTRDIGFKKRSFSGETSSAILGLGDRGEDRHVRDLGPIVYRLSAYEAAGQIVVEGDVRMSARFRCSRCDRFFSLTVTDPEFCMLLEAPENDEFVDLTADLRESILLRFPAYPVCREACPGLCPQCGANRAETPCGCRQPADDRWSALDGLGAGRRGDDPGQV